MNRFFKEEIPNMSVGDGGYSSGGASLSQAGFDPKLWNYAVDQDYQTPDESGLNKWRFSNVYPVSRLSMKNVDSMVKSSNRFVKIMDERNRKQVMNNLQSGLSEETNKCKSGYYYCFTDKKCKKIPMGYYVGRGGYLSKDNDDSENKKKNGNGNGNGNVSNGNGNGNGGNGNGSGSSGSNGGNGGGMSEGNLRQWFKGSKSKDGKGGWVNVVTGGTCASDEPGEGTPKCVSSAKRASMTKKERLSAQRRKKAADPGQQQKSGAAKPTYVSTDKKKMKEEKLMSVSEVRNAYAVGMAAAKKKYNDEPPLEKKTIKKAHEIADAIKNENLDEIAPLAVGAAVAGLAAAPYLAKKFLKPKSDKALEKATKSNKMPLATGGTQADLRRARGIKEIAPAVAVPTAVALRTLAPMAVKQLTRAALMRLMLQGVRRDTPEPEENEMKKEQKLLSVSEAKDKKGKGSGTKDACYHKVKSRYSVWPSAYASGALVKCRKVGAANWGNKSEEYVTEFASKATVERIKREGGNAPSFDTGGMTAPNNGGLKGGNQHLRKKNKKVEEAKAVPMPEYRPEGSGRKPVPMPTVKGSDKSVPMPRYKYKDGKFIKVEEESVDNLDEKCWAGYEKKGMKTMFGKRYPNCVKKTKKEEVELVDERSRLDGPEERKKDLDRRYDPKGGGKNPFQYVPVKQAMAKKEDVDLSDNLIMHVEGMGDVRYCPQCEKNETREECSYGPKNWDMNSRPMALGANTFDIATVTPANEEYVDEKYERIQKMGRTYTMFFTFRGQYKSLQFFFPTSKRPSREDVLVQLRKIYPEAVLVNFFERDRIENEPLVTVEGAKRFDQFQNNAIVEGAAWTKKSGKDSEGGLNEKGRKSYERENPGSDLKRPSKKVGNPRRKSFCARMKGMKAKLTSAKTARDPDSRINKSLRAWNC